MTSSRRSLIAGAGAALAACHAPPPIFPRQGILHPDRLDGAIADLAKRAGPGVLGAGAMTPRDQKAWYFQQTERFPMASLANLPLAAAALAEVDAGRLRLDDRIKITELDLSAPPSAINQRWPTPPEHHAAATPAIDLIALAIQRNDNTAADVILKTIGGPGAMTARLDAWGMKDMRIDRYQRELAQDCAGMAPFRPEWKDEAAWTAARESIPAEVREKAMTDFLADPRDTTTPGAAALLLDKLVIGELVSPRSTNLLLRLMGSTAGGGGPMATVLPGGARLAHLAGASRSDVGRTPAANDVGVITFAGGARLVIAVLISGSTATAAERAKLIADFAAAAIGSVS